MEGDGSDNDQHDLPGNDQPGPSNETPGLPKGNVQGQKHRKRQEIC